ncbi:carbohydrate binding domain-containing protein [Flammeovirga sp. EKP202]|uniref:carbohydrate binding domain-containing protein n=1 Tax=Flammeovirga sp. EKP202 TaxID=2770592 RepID=UPI00165FD033|nr:carbohydrate binding domain-containing protein [Flammeovirga sp. EKP202]MBD0401812.1 carbohydrate binding domain-containing protein [Flammeovirga sp. EKP202]
MKILKNISLGVMALVIALTSCQKDEVVPYGDFQDIAIFSPYANQITVEINQQISIADGSKGFLDRKWTVPFPSYFINNDDSVLKEETAFVKFMEVGEIPLKIEWEFEDSTGIYMEDSTFLVTVLDTITTDIAVTGIEGNYTEENGRYIVEAGSIVTMTDTSSGSPDTYEWLIDGQEETLETKTVDIQYKKLGKFSVGLVSSRVEPYGRADTLIIPDYIEVIPSTLPVVMTGAEESSNGGTLQLQFSREMDAIDASQIPAFTVKVDGAAATINAVQLNKNDASIVEIVLANDIYNSQSAVVSYDATVGTVQSSDFVKLETFTDQDVKVYIENLLTINPDFEDGTISPFASPWNQKGFANVNVLSSGAQSGTKVLNIVMDEGTNAQMGMDQGFISLSKDKTYAFEYWVKVKSNPGGNGLQMTWRVMPSDGWADNYKEWMGVCCTNALKPENEGVWQKVQILTNKQPPADWPSAKLHLQIISGAGGQTEVEFDNFKFYEYEVPAAE